MNVERYKAETLRTLFKRRRIVTMPELKKALGTEVDMTVFRKLRRLSYRTSYSHGGRFYTLDEFARFDDGGLWCHKGAWFSKHGTLLATLEALVNEADAGFLADELRERLHVSVKESLLRLTKKGAVSREQVDGRYLYCATAASVRRKQLRARRLAMSEIKSADPDGGPSDEVKAAVVLFTSLLDEKQKRLFAGLEALKLGSGGDRRIAELLGLHPQTVAKGRHQLLERDVELERVRRAGGGRKPVEKKRRRSSRRSKK